MARRNTPAPFDAFAPGSDSRGGRDGGDRWTLLLAEDDDDFRVTVRYWLADDDRWDLREAVDGREAVERLDGDVDVLVLDRHMPGLSGRDVLDRIDGTPFDWRVVVLSAYRPDGQVGADDPNVDEYVTKPVDRAGFMEPLEAVRR